MDLHPIRNEREYKEALAQAERLMDLPESDHSAARDLEHLVILIKAYEEKHYPVGLPGPVETRKFVMDQRDLSRKDLARVLGSESRVSDVLSGKRRLSLTMVAALHREFGIPVEGLIDLKARPKTRGRAQRVGGRYVRSSPAARRRSRR